MWEKDGARGGEGGHKGDSEKGRDGERERGRGRRRELFEQVLLGEGERGRG